MIKVILFDFYGVFLPDAYTAWLKANHQSRDGVYTDLIAKRDKGHISESDFLDGLSRAMSRKITIDEIHSENIKLDTELVSLVRALKENYKICLFSNASTKLRQKLKTLAIDDLFEEVIISGEIGHVKPTDEAFAIAITRTGVKNGEILFIDDNTANIEAALKNGMQAYLYTSINKLRAALPTFE